MAIDSPESRYPRDGEQGKQKALRMINLPSLPLLPAFVLLAILPISVVINNKVVSLLNVDTPHAMSDTLEARPRENLFFSDCI